MGFKFGKSSNNRVKSCHEDLQKILYLAIGRSVIDFGVAEGHRPISLQREYYAVGRTKDLHKKPITNIDGINKKGKHNYEPSEAADIFVWHNDKEIRMKIAYDKVHLAYVMGIIYSCAEELLEKGKITHKIRWGGNWDSDGIIIFDQSFDDLPHIEIIPV